MRTRLILNCILLPLFLPLNPLRAEPAPSDPAAIVNGQAISFAELDRQVESASVDIRSCYQGAELETKIRALQLEKLNALIYRVLIIQAFYKDGGKIPDGYIDAQVDAIVKEQYGGDRAAFDQTLRDRGILLATYRQEIVDSAIIGYMHTKIASDKVPQTTTDESEQSSQGEFSPKEWREWLTSQRKNANIKIYLPQT
ncbi:MAG: SurA N-terminal domain-containing protein [Methylacidiphilales bacterium]|nr:SurA N-terminal domain-containing protein [Candidatus Methylacidiphilales bacterium]